MGAPEDVTEQTRGLLDTSVIIATDVGDLPDESSISAATLAELHAGVHLAPDDDERKNRMRLLAEVESAFDPIPIDDRVARAYGALAHTMATSGKRVRTRVMDVLIVATAQVHALPLYTRNVKDFAVFADEIDVRSV